jgi:hypothetical protein
MSLCLVATFVASLVVGDGVRIGPLVITIPDEPVPLASSFELSPSGRYREQALGVLEPAGLEIRREGNAALDVTHLDEGYLFVRYEGPHSRVLVTIEHETANPGDQAVYAFPSADTGVGVDVDTGGDGAGIGLDSGSDSSSDDGFNADTSGGSSTAGPTINNAVWHGLALPYGAGAYTLQVCANDGTSSIYTDRAIFNLVSPCTDEAQSFKYRTAQTWYEPDDLLVDKAFMLVEAAASETKDPLSDADKTGLIVAWVHRNIEIDRGLIGQIEAGELESRHLPTPAITFEQRSGICSDKAALAAAMLKSLGIPARMINGKINLLVSGTPEATYHAWVEVYLDGEWARYDPTFFDTEVVDDFNKGSLEYLTRDLVL